MTLSCNTPSNTALNTPSRGDKEDRKEASRVTPSGKLYVPEGGITTDSREVSKTPLSTLNRRARLSSLIVVLTACACVCAMAVAMGMGQLNIPIETTLKIVSAHISRLFGIHSSLQGIDPSAVVAVSQIRIPRILLSVVVGGSLAVSGAVLQSLFHNPLVSPAIVGVSSAASFGGVLAILFGFSGTMLMGSAFLGGICAVVCVLLIGQVRTTSPTLTIILGGVVVSAFFNAMVSLISYVADPYTKLPSITFWLMGSFAAATWEKTLAVIPAVVVGLVVVVLLRWKINILSLGDDDARTLGVHPVFMRWVCIVAVSLLTAASVATAGIIGWVGLVIPHLVRLIVGHDNRVVIPESFLLGGLYLLIIDTIARCATSVEIPVGILTATVGAPVFIALLLKKSS